MLARLLVFLLLCSGLSACSALSPEKKTREERLAAFPTTGLPVEQPVTIRWNAFQVPYIEAKTDRDLAFALGLVHGHLRLAQIRLLKQASQGRLSEMIGPFTQDIDHAIRILDYGRASAEIVRRMPSETRVLLEAFVHGLNHYQARLREMPPEFGLLGLEPEPFTIEDLLTIGRLAGTDVNWLAYLSLLPQRDEPDWPLIWARALEAGSGPTVSFKSHTRQAFNDLLWGASRSGSNAVVVAPEKSASGAPLIASDPHLGVSVPNLWLMAGIRSPSFAGVGLMIPGLPFLALGRTADIAWGGTNMRAANSDLYDIAEAEDAAIETETTRIGTRFWFDAERKLRRSRFGSILSDSPLVPARPDEVLALRWVGHLPTDEVSSLFRVMRARNARDFHASLAGFAVSPQNFLCADRHGNICHVLATMLPKRTKQAPDGLVLPAGAESDWASLADATELPAAINPPEGFLASANNRPTDAPWPIGYFFNADERIRRLKQIIAEDERVSVDDLKALQRDTVSLAARRIHAALMPLIEADAAGADPAFLARLRSFDGDYRADAAGPVAFETLLYHLVPAVYGYETAEAVPQHRKQFAILARYFADDVAALPRAKRRAIFAAAIESAARDAGRFPRWGDMHRLKIQHWLANAPVIGGYFEYGDYPVGGSRETIMKTAHGLSNTQSTTQYGSQARHISDMSDPDANYFVLIGGNDGWLGSVNALDQVSLWLEGGYVRMPLTSEIVAAEFPTIMILKP